MKLLQLSLAAVAALALGLAAPTIAQDNSKVLDWDVMAGVKAPYTGAANPIRGVGGGGQPWTISRGTGVLRANGDLDIHVRGLVLTNTGQNPAATFRAIVSCQSRDAAGAPTVVNVQTDEFPATPAGDSRIRATVALPDPCFAPIVFVTNAAGRWFAVTGFNRNETIP